MPHETKKALAESLKKIMMRKSLDRITIKEIVENCMVNRQTFYYHFQDIYELLGWIYKTEAVDSISNCKSYETWQQGFLKIFYYVSNNKVFCMNTFKSMGRDHLETFLHAEISPLIFDVINEVSKDSNITSDEKKFISDFYTFAFIGILTSWMKSDMKESPESIILKVENLVTGDIKKVMNHNK